MTAAVAWLRRGAAAAFIGLALLAAPAAGPARAQGLSLGGDAADNNKPIEIQADSGIEWDQNAKLYIARGHAVATRGTGQVFADTLVAHYRPAAKGSGTNGSSTEIYRIDADGHVVIKGPTQTITGDHAVYDVDKAVVVVTGKNLKMTTPTDVVTARDSLEWYDQKQIAVARGDAVAIRNGKTIKADILTAYMTKTPAKSGTKPAAAPASAREPAAKPGAPATETSKISRIDAQGHVVVYNATDIGRGDFGVYNADTGIVTLIDNVVITRGRDVVKGQYAVMDLNRNVSRIMTGPRGTATPGRQVQGLFVRQDQTPGRTPDRTARTPGRAAPR